MVKKSELVEMVKKAMGNADEFISVTNGDTNPQVVEMYHKAQGKRAAYHDVLDALLGNAIFLRIDAGR